VKQQPSEMFLGAILRGLVPGLELYTGAITRQGQKGRKYVRRVG